MKKPLELWLLCLLIPTLSVAQPAVEIIQGKPKQSAAISKKTTRLDLDKNGRLSFAELKAEHERQISAFELADANKDGELSATEKKVFMRSVRLKK
jgi:EF hand